MVLIYGGGVGLRARERRSGGARAPAGERGRKRGSSSRPSFSSAFGPWLKRFPLSLITFLEPASPYEESVSWRLPAEETLVLKTGLNAAVGVGASWESEIGLSISGRKCRDVRPREASVLCSKWVAEGRSSDAQTQTKGIRISSVFFATGIRRRDSTHRERRGNGSMIENFETARLSLEGLLGRFIKGGGYAFNSCFWSLEVAKLYRGCVSSCVSG